MLGPIISRLVTSLTFYPLLALALFLIVFVLVTHKALRNTNTDRLQSLPLSKEDES